MESQASNQKVNVHKLEEKIRSKKELYNFLQQDCKAFLPHLEATNVYFFKQILKGEKEYLNRGEVKLAAIPQIEGLTAQNFLELLKSKPSIVKYFPDERDWTHLDKQWICNVLYTLDQDGIQDMINEAMRTRKDKLEEKRSLCIEMKPEFADALQNCLNFSTERGKSVSLLKDSSKRKRKKNELDEVREEEQLLKQDKQKYLLEGKRRRLEESSQEEGKSEVLSQSFIEGQSFNSQILKGKPDVQMQKSHK